MADLESLAREIEALSPPERLRLAAGLLEARKPKLAYALIASGHDVPALLDHIEAVEAELDAQAAQLREAREHDPHRRAGSICADCLRDSSQGHNDKCLFTGLRRALGGTP